MFSALFSFLGGSVFRMVWGEISAYLTARQNHNFELERLKAQDAIDAASHDRNMATIKLQADMGVKVIEAQTEAKITESDVSAWSQAVADVGKTTGIKFLDVWNGSVRPLLATLAICVVVFEIIKNGFVLSDWDRELVGAILGIYVADRSLGKRGK